MPELLRKIVEQKRVEVEALRERARRLPEPGRRESRSFPLRPARAVPGFFAIAEIKRRSPSAGRLREQVDPAALARSYERAGAAAISVVTDRCFFGGSADDLVAARAACELPILRKDFLIDRAQIDESAAIGADAVLLIARLLDGGLLDELAGRAFELGLGVLVETHGPAEVERAIGVDRAAIGVNSRDLDTLEVDLARTLRARASIPSWRVAIAESGITGRADVRAVADAGFDGMLVGTALMHAPNPGARLAELLREARR